MVVIGVGCSSNNSSGTRLSRPKWECPRPAGDELTSGSGASHDDNHIHLRWIIGSEPELVGYQIYRRLGADAVDTLYRTYYLDREQLDLRGTGATMEWVDSSTSLGVFAFYVLYALDDKDGISDASDTLGYMTTSKPESLIPALNEHVADSTPLFIFSTVGIEPYAVGFTVRVVTDSSTSRTVWVSSVQPFSGLTPHESQRVQYGTVDGSSGYLLRPFLSPGRYRWRADFHGLHSYYSAEATVPCYCAYDSTRCPDGDSELPPADKFYSVGSRSWWVNFTVDY